MMALAAGLPTSFRDREDVRPEGETSLGMRQVLPAPTTSRLRGPPSGGPVTHNGEGPLRITGALHPPFHPAASLPAAVRLKDPHVVPSGVNQRDFPSFSLETTRVMLSAMKIGEIRGGLGWGVGGIMP